MASTDADSARRPGRKRTSRRLFCCSCLRSAEERDPLQEQEEKINEGLRPAHPDQRGSGEKEAIQITVEDLGVVNAGFSLFDEDPLTPRNNMGRSASSVSACLRALKKKQLQCLSSLPLQPQARQAITSTSEEDYEEDEEDPMLFDSGTDSTPASGSLLTPVINLIPPTPSDVIDDDQFFDINSEESGTHTPVSGDQESVEEKLESEQTNKSKDRFPLAKSTVGVDRENKSEEGLHKHFREEREVLPTKDEEEENSKLRFLRGVHPVAPLLEQPQKWNFNAGINLLSFTEHNLAARARTVMSRADRLDDPSNKDVNHCEILKNEPSLLPQAATMDIFTQQRRPITRSRSLGPTLTRSATFHALTLTSEHQSEEEEQSQLQRRQTLASYIPQSKDQNGNFPEKGADKQEAKSLRELNTDEVCQWFTTIGLQKCLPFIREAKLCGKDVASVNVNTLDLLQIATMEDREQLLSAIYNELHPPSTITQRLDSLLESSGPNHVETFTATLVSMNKSKSSPHVSCLSMNRRSLKLRNNNQNYMVQRNSHLIEITINASERIVHLRTPKETTVAKVIDSCIKMLGATEDRSLFSLKEKQDSSTELLQDQQIGSLIASPSENRLLELHLCKMEKPPSTTAPDGEEANNSNETGNKNVQPAKEERIRELNQQVDSLQNVILQVQELHHGLVAFCSELKNMDGDVNVDKLGSTELKQKLELVKSRLNDKRQSLQSLRDNINNSAAHKKKQLDVRLLEKMKMNCQVFKEEISLVHLNRQAASLQNALQERNTKEEAQKKSLTISSLSQLVSAQSPAMLLLVQETPGPEGAYRFKCRRTECSGLVVAEVDDSHLCVEDRLVEVNGVPVVNSTAEELSDLLLQSPVAQIVVLRQPPPPALAAPHHMADPDPLPTVCPERDVIAMETPSLRKVMAI